MEEVTQSEKPSWEAILPTQEKSMHKCLRICTDACGRERIPGSVWSLQPTESINQEKGKSTSYAGQRTFWSYSQGSCPGQETHCLPVLFLSPLLPMNVFIKMRGKRCFCQKFPWFPKAVWRNAKMFGQVSSFASFLWRKIESLSGSMKRLLMVSLGNKHLHGKMAFGKLTCFPLALKPPLTEKASPFEILV